MPELPEVETVRRTLEPLLAGKCIESFDLLWPRTLAADDPDEFRRRIHGRTISGVDRRGKLLVLRLDSGDVITIHLRMTGELLFHAAGAPPREAGREPYLRAAIGLAGGDELLFYDTRKFGRIKLYRHDQTDQLDRALGVEPLGEQFSADELGRILRRRRRLKSLLLDQRVIAGIGNIYADEALFTARLHPLRQADSLDVAEATALRDAIVGVLSTAVASQGTTLRDYRSGLGEPGTNQHRLNVYGKRVGSPCPRCGAPLARITVDQRSTTFCPECQPEIRRMPNR